MTNGKIGTSKIWQMLTYFYMRNSKKILSSSTLKMIIKWQNLLRKKTYK